MHSSILKEAEAIINGDRAATYGDIKVSFDRIALMWSAILGIEVTGKQVGLMMICLKVSREVSNTHRDNLVDIGGYAGCLEKYLSPTPKFTLDEGEAK